MAFVLLKTFSYMMPPSLLWCQTVFLSMSTDLRNKLEKRICSRLKLLFLTFMYSWKSRETDIFIVFSQQFHKFFLRSHLPWGRGLGNYHDCCITSSCCISLWRHKVIQGNSLSLAKTFLAFFSCKKIWHFYNRIIFPHMSNSCLWQCCRLGFDKNINHAANCQLVWHFCFHDLYKSKILEDNHYNCYITISRNFWR